MGSSKKTGQEGKILYIHTLYISNFVAELCPKNAQRATQDGRNPGNTKLEGGRDSDGRRWVVWGHCMEIAASKAHNQPAKGQPPH